MRRSPGDAATLRRCTRTEISFAGTNISVEDGEELLSTHFDFVKVDRLLGEIVVDDAAPVMSYFDSARDFVVPQLSPEWSWNATREAFLELVTADLARDGVWRTTTESGIIVCC